MGISSKLAPKSPISKHSSISTVVPKSFYPIGTPGQPWTDQDDAKWKASTKVQRSYRNDVLQQLEPLRANWQVEQYGALSHDADRYPLMAIRTKPTEWKKDCPTILVTGGVHGYETSGVKGAILFAQEAASTYASKVNIVIAPCVSPWSYEHIQRWQADLKDPNRSFTRHADSALHTEEADALMTYLRTVFPPSATSSSWSCHVDLHETTNTDATEFMPAKHAKAGLMYQGEIIPDGFYLVGDIEIPQLDFQKSIVERVGHVTHIAPNALHVNIVEEPLIQEGVVFVPARKLGMCCSVTGARYVTTTEVYPDSPTMTADVASRAQVAAIQGAIEYVLAHP